MTDLIIAGIIAFVIACAVYLRKSISFWGSALAALAIIEITFFAGLVNMTCLLFSYFLIALTDSLIRHRVTEKYPDRVNGIVRKSGTRDFIQVSVNGFASMLFAALFGFFKKPCFLVAYATGLAEALSDSLASDVGIFSKREPVSILTFRPVVRGLSGGISVLGTLSGLAGSSAVAVFFSAVNSAGVRPVIIIALSSFAGMLLDSVLGAALQVRYVCPVCNKTTEHPVHCGEKGIRTGKVRFLNNDTVNLLSNLISASMSAVIFELI